MTVFVAICYGMDLYVHIPFWQDDAGVNNKVLSKTQPYGNHNTSHTQSKEKHMSIQLNNW